MRGDTRDVVVTTVMSHPVLAVSASAFFSDALHALVTHGLRHLAFLRDHDAEVGAALDANWRRHLAPLEPALFTMFSERLAG